MNVQSPSPDSPPRTYTLATVGAALRAKWWVVVTPMLLAGIFALGISALQTEQFRASSTLYVTSGTSTSTQNAYQGSLAS